MLQQKQAATVQACATTTGTKELFAWATQQLSYFDFELAMNFFQLTKIYLY